MQRCAGEFMRFRTVFFGLSLMAALMIPGVSAYASSSQTPAGVYRLDPRHFSLLFRVDHLGFSHIVGRFNAVEATLSIDPAQPEEAQMSAVIDANSIDTNVETLDTFLKGASMLNAAAAPQIKFEMGNLDLSSADTGKVKGLLSMAGKSLEVSFDVRLVGAGRNPFEEAYVLGFTATGHLKRSEWGLSAFTPNVGDAVLFSFDGEFVHTSSP